MSIFIIWAYHCSSDVLPGQFLKHSFEGLQQVTLIPAATLTPTTNLATTPTKGGVLNVVDEYNLIRTATEEFCALHRASKGFWAPGLQDGKKNDAVGLHSFTPGLQNKHFCAVHGKTIQAS